MNDLLEYENGNKEYWKTLFFTCFMCENNESIGMWSMYAQPWNQGVKISIPRKTLMKWLKSKINLYEVNTDDYSIGENIDSSKYKAFLSCVAYADFFKNNTETIRWSNQKNDNNIFADSLNQLTGYLKDEAWSYEKELRLKVELKDKSEINRLAIEIPEFVIDDIILTPSPLFQGNLLEDIKVKLQDSLFKDRLNIITPCDKCSLKSEKPILENEDTTVVQKSDYSLDLLLT